MIHGFAKGEALAGGSHGNRSMEHTKAVIGLPNLGK